MRKTILRLAALSLVALVLFAPTAGARGKTMTVSIKGFAFNPPNATVAPGTTVTWVNNDQAPHTATANDGAFDSGTLQPGQSYSFVFDKAGTYAYHCNIHPDMTGTITVSGASASASASSSGSAMATSPTSSAISSPTASASTQQLPSSGGSSLELVAGLALVAFAIALVLVLERLAMILNGRHYGRMKAYSDDLRKKIVQAVERGMPKTEAARSFGVGISSVKRYVAAARQGRSLAPKKRPGSKPKLDQGARRLLEADLHERPAATLPERREFLRRVSGVEVSDSTISRVLRRMGFSRKKDR